MSRHEIKPINPNHTCTVGYDHGLKTFFAQVIDADIERRANEAADRVAEAYDRQQQPDAKDLAASNLDSMVFWIGASRVNEVPTVEALAMQLAPYAFIEPEMLETLRSDQQQVESTPRTRHQIDMLDFVQRQTPRS